MKKTGTRGRQMNRIILSVPTPMTWEEMDELRHAVGRLPEQTIDIPTMNGEMLTVPLEYIIDWKEDYL